MQLCTVPGLWTGLLFFCVCLLQVVVLFSSSFLLGLSLITPLPLFFTHTHSLSLSSPRRQCLWHSYPLLPDAFVPRLSVFAPLFSPFCSSVLTAPHLRCTAFFLQTQSFPPPPLLSFSSSHAIHRPHPHSPPCTTHSWRPRWLSSVAKVRRIRTTHSNVCSMPQWTIGYLAFLASRATGFYLSELRAG